MRLCFTSPLVCVAQLLENSCCIAKNCCVEQVKEKVGGRGHKKGWGRGERSVDVFLSPFLPKKSVLKFASVHGQEPSRFQPKGTHRQTMPTRLLQTRSNLQSN